MRILQRIVLLVIFITLINTSRAQVVKIIPDTVEYQKIDTTDLHFYIYRPIDFEVNKKYPAIVFYHGGGWNSGSPKAFNRQCMYFASRGIIAITVEYRIKNTHGTTPFEASDDALTALKYIAGNAEALNIKESMIAVGGGSAGGQLAAYCSFSTNRAQIDKKLRVPDALVLFNPVLNTGKDGFANRRMDGRYEVLSPLHNIAQGAPPTLIMVGTKDKVLPVETAEKYKAKMIEAGSQCEIVYYEGEEHAFFSRKVEYFVATTYEADKFLQSLGYLEGEPNIYEQYAHRLEAK